MPPVRIDGSTDQGMQPIPAKPDRGFPAWAALLSGLVVGLLLIGGG